MRRYWVSGGRSNGAGNLNGNGMGFVNGDGAGNVNVDGGGYAYKPVVCRRRGNDHRNGDHVADGPKQDG